MTVDVDNLANALQTCAALKSCDRCSYKEKCLQHPSVNAAMADAAAYIRESSKFIKRRLNRRITPQELISRYPDPVYIITTSPNIDTWMFYVGFIKSKRLFIFRDPDGQVYDLFEEDYGKLWLAFTDRVTDKEREQAKKKMEEANKE